MSKIDNWKGESKIDILIFGTGKSSINFIKKLKRSINIVAYIDNDINKQESLFKGKKIISPKDISIYEYDYIVIASCYYREIIEQLLKLGIDCKYIKCVEDTVDVEKYIRDFTPIYSKTSIVLERIGLYKNRVIERELFNPTWLSIFFNEAYFARKGLMKYINKHKKYVKGRCMDLGCGTQPYKEILECNEYIGVEIAGDKQDYTENIVYYDGEVLPFKDDFFDSIFSTQVFEHISNLEEILIECKRVLKNNGVMLITVPFIYPEHLMPYDYKRYTSEGVKKLLEKYGFEIIEYEKTSSFIECIFQLKLVYISQVLRKNKFIAKSMIFFVNITGIIINKIFPITCQAYLDNVIVIKNIKGENK